MPHLVRSSQQPGAEHRPISLEMRRLEFKGEWLAANSTQAGPSRGGREQAGLVWTQSLQSPEPGGLWEEGRTAGVTVQGVRLRPEK